MLPPTLLAPPLQVMSQSIVPQLPCLWGCVSCGDALLPEKGGRREEHELGVRKPGLCPCSEVAHPWPWVPHLPALGSLSSFVGVEDGWSFPQGWEGPDWQVQVWGLHSAAL